MELTPSMLDASQKIFYLDLPQLNQVQIGDAGSDVTVNFGGVSLRCHKRFLEALSPYFKRKFNTLLIDNNTNVVNLEEDDEGGIKSLIEMAYSNQLRVNFSNVQDIAVAADYLLMEKLKFFVKTF